MKLTILGTGTSTLTRGKACSAYFVQKQKGGIGIDMGAGVLMRYLDASINYINIDALILTHTDHPDHVSDLSMFFLSLNYTRGRERVKPLNLYLAKGRKVFLDKLFELFPKAKPKSYELSIVEVEN